MHVVTEHPSQFTMDDVDLSLGDKNLVKTLSESFTYHKTEVAFKSVKDLQKCPYLGGKYNKKVEKKHVKELKKKDKVRF